MNETDLTTAVLNLTSKVGEQTGVTKSMQSEISQMRADNAADHTGVVSSIDNLRSSVEKGQEKQDDRIGKLESGQARIWGAVGAISAAVVIARLLVS